MKTFLSSLHSGYILLFITCIFTAKSQCTLTANFNFSVGANGLVNFVSTSTGTSATTYYFWNFNDGTGTSGTNVNSASHTYSYNQVYNVSLSISDSLPPAPSCYATTTKTVSVASASCGGTPSFTYYVGANGNVWFTNTSVGISPNANYTFAYGDGTSNSFFSSSHTYSSAGVYNVSVTATDPLSVCSYSTVQSVTVSIMTCSLNAAFTYTNGTGATLNFLSVSSGTSPTTNYFWNFGDGGYGGGQSTSHTYTSNGVYTVTHNVIDSVQFTCSSLSTQTINLNSPCIVNTNFTMAKDSALMPAIVWNAYPNYPSNIVSAVWSWGDGTSTTALYPSHTYSGAGTYNICLTVSVSCGLTTTTCMNTSIYKMLNPDEVNGIATVNIINTNSVTALKSQDRGENLIMLFPNPNNGEFEVSLSGENTVSIKIYNLFGEEVYQSIEFATQGKILKKISLLEMPDAAYYLKIDSENISYRTKLIIVK